MKIELRGFSDDARRITEDRIRTALGNPNGSLQIDPGILMPNESGFVAVIEGSDEELGDARKKSALVDTVFDQITVIAGDDAIQARLAKGCFSRSRNAR